MILIGHWIENLREIFDFSAISNLSIELLTFINCRRCKKRKPQRSPLQGLWSVYVQVTTSMLFSILTAVDCCAVVLITSQLLYVISQAEIAKRTPTPFQVEHSYLTAYDHTHARTHVIIRKTRTANWVVLNILIIIPCSFKQWQYYMYWYVNLQYQLKRGGRWASCSTLVIYTQFSDVARTVIGEKGATGPTNQVLALTTRWWLFVMTLGLARESWRETIFLCYWLMAS